MSGHMYLFDVARADLLYNGPLINLVVLAHAVFERASEEEVVLNVAWTTFEAC